MSQSWWLVWNARLSADQQIYLPRFAMNKYLVEWHLVLPFHFPWFSVPSTGHTRQMDEFHLGPTNYSWAQAPRSHQRHLLKGLFWNKGDPAALREARRELWSRCWGLTKFLLPRPWAVFPDPAKSVGGAAFFKRLLGEATQSLGEDGKTKI